MTAQMLRQAAALMRERAEAATPGPWCTEPDTLAGRVWVTLAPRRFWGTGDVEPLFQVRPPSDAAKGQKVADAAHIASWHPAVALAVADWLDAAAYVSEIAEDGYLDPAALAVATAYLGAEVPA